MKKIALLFLILFACVGDVPDEGAVEEVSSALTNEPFFAYELPQWTGAGVTRINPNTVRFSANYFTGFGQENEKNFWIQNRHANRTIQPDHPAVGGVEWNFNFSPGSPCLGQSQRCTFHICLSEGTSWPRCIQTRLIQGGTNDFNGEFWPAGSWKRWTLVYQVDDGTPTTATTQWLYLRHSP
jgi:hypothetical protein